MGKAKATPPSDEHYERLLCFWNPTGARNAAGGCLGAQRRRIYYTTMCSKDSTGLIPESILQHRNTRLVREELRMVQIRRRTCKHIRTSV